VLQKKRFPGFKVLDFSGEVCSKRACSKSAFKNLERLYQTVRNRMLSGVLCRILVSTASFVVCTKMQGQNRYQLVLSLRATQNGFLTNTGTRWSVIVLPSCMYVCLHSMGSIDSRNVHVWVPGPDYLQHIVRATYRIRSSDKCGCRGLSAPFTLTVLLRYCWGFQFVSNGRQPAGNLV